MTHDPRTTLTRLWDDVDPGPPPVAEWLADGRALRQRRHRLLLTGALTAAVLVGSGGWLATAVPDDGTTVSDPPAATDGATADQGDTASRSRITGAGAAAALLHAVQQVQEGTASAFTGQDPNPGNENVGASAQLQWVERGVPGASVIDVTVQTGTDVADYTPSCVDMGGFELSRCTVEQLSDGTVAMTYDERRTYDSGVGIRRHAEAKRPDGTYVQVSSTNGFDELARGLDWDVTRPLPALSFAQLQAIAVDPLWGADLPTAFVVAGESLDAYAPITPFGS